MTRLDFQNHGNDDLRVAVFRAIAAVGWAVRPQLRALFSQLDDKGPGYQHVIDSIQNRLHVAFNTGYAPEPRDYVLRAQDEIGAMAAHFPTTPHVGPLISEIAAGIRWVDDAECANQFEVINQQAYALAQECGKRWGTAAVQHAYSQHPVADLAVLREAGTPPTRYDRDEESILFPVGDVLTTLHDYLAIEFSFFHEYTSHVFTRVDDSNRTYSDGYLFWLQRLAYPHLTSVPMLPMLVNQHWNNHQAAHHSASGGRDLACYCAEFFHGECEAAGRFPSLLLDIGIQESLSRRSVGLFVGQLKQILESSNTEWLSAARSVLNGPLNETALIFDSFRGIVKGPIDTFLRG